MRIGGGFGSSKSVSAQTHLKAHYTDRHATMGFPIALWPNNPVFLTPGFTYDYFKTEFSNHHVKEKGFAASIMLQSYFQTGMGNKQKLNANKWPQTGVSFIEFTTGANLGFSTRKEMQGTVRFGDVKYRNSLFKIGYHYYFMDYLAVGINISYVKNKTINLGSSPLVDSKFGIQPTVTANAPVDGPLHNLFLQVAYNIQTGKNAGNPNSGGTMPLRLGYNFFLAKNVSLTPKVGYDLEHHTNKTPGGDYKYRSSGLAAEIGLRAWLNCAWLSKQ